MAPIIHPRQSSLSNKGLPLPYGAYSDIISDTSTHLWDREGGLVKHRRTQRKAWVFTGAYTRDLMVGLAVADAGYIATAFAYFYLPAENIYEEIKALVPYGFPDQFDPGLFDSWKLRNIEISTHNGVLEARASGKFNLSVRIRHSADGLSFICPSVSRPFNFTYKNLGLESEIDLQYRGRRFSAAGRIGGIDFSKGYPPRNTSWNWAMVIGQDQEGLPIGMNLFRGHNGKYENAAWIGSEPVLLSNTDFIYDRSKPADSQNWKLRTEDGLVDLDFTPSASRKEKINAGLISHDFIQPFGKFEGTISHKGMIHKVTGYGPVEDHTSLW